MYNTKQVTYEELVSLYQRNFHVIVRHGKGNICDNIHTMSDITSIYYVNCSFHKGSHDTVVLFLHLMLIYREEKSASLFHFCTKYVRLNFYLNRTVTLYHNVTILRLIFTDFNCVASFEFNTYTSYIFNRIPGNPVLRLLSNRYGTHSV